MSDAILEPTTAAPEGGPVLSPAQEAAARFLLSAINDQD